VTHVHIERVDSGTQVLAPSHQRVLLLRRFLGPLLSIGMLCLALWVLHLFAREVNYHQIRQYVQGLPHGRFVLAALLTALGYVVMTLYDRCALISIQRKLPWRRVSMISFISYAFSNAVGMSLLVSGSIRYRFYIQNGLSTGDVARVVLFCTTSFWLGLLALTGVTLLWIPLPPELPLAALRLPVGAALTLVPLAWLFAAGLVRHPLRVWRWHVALPSLRMAAQQIVIGAMDWGLAAAVLYVLMPNALDSGFGHFLAIFVIAQMVGLISHVPGGLGVFEAVMLAGFGATGNQVLAAPILGALAAYRVIYYLLPLCAAAVLVVQRETRGLRRKSLWTPWFTALLPSFFAGLTLVSGAVLLFSGATRALPERMAILREVLPLSVLEVSHLLASVIGMLLLILARGLQRRLDAAYVLTLALLIAGAGFSLLKGIDYEEATLLTLLAMGLAPAHRLFYRRASLFNTTFSIGWVVAIVAVLGCATWLVMFSYKHVGYSADLWWEFSFHQGAPRALRALVAAAAAGMLFALASLIRPVQVHQAAPSEEQLDTALPLIRQSPDTQAYLALMGDKALLFDPMHAAFIMYDVEGRSWVAMGDPIGTDDDARRELVWTFLEQCERAGGWPVFYQVSPADLDLYLEVGMNLLKIGEQARVRLATFNLDGKSRKVLRNTVNKLTRDGLRLQIIPASAVAPLLPRLKEISDAWLRAKHVREKRFSLGAFDPRYLVRTPMALIWQGEQLVAFANLLLGATKHEASLDLMRHLPDGAPGIMDFMFVQLLQWARDEGYEWFNLGMAPLAGLHNRRLAPLWNRFGAMVFGRGERFYNFRGLQQYKDKFDPEWEPRYMAVPGSIALPMILANVASLISGGLSGVVRR